jgi:hypothetical protein
MPEGLAFIDREGERVYSLARPKVSARAREKPS